MTSTSLLNHSGAASSKTKSKSNKELASFRQQQSFCRPCCSGSVSSSIGNHWITSPASVPLHKQQSIWLSIFLASYLGVCICAAAFGSIHWLWPTISLALRLIILRWTFVSASPAPVPAPALAKACIIAFSGILARCKGLFSVSSLWVNGVEICLTWLGILNF